MAPKTRRFWGLTSQKVYAAPWERAALAGLLVLTGTLLAYLAWRTGVTADEPGHMVGARLYWQGADRLPPGDMPPLIKIAGGWMLRQMPIPLPADLGRPGDMRREWEVGLAMMEKIPYGRIQSTVFRARLPMIVFPLMSTVLVWLWARTLFSPPTGIIAAALFALEPTSLAHGALFKNDHAATFAYLLFWFSIWLYWRSQSFSRAALVAVATAVCMMAKLSLLFLFALAPGLIILAGLSRDRWRGVVRALLMAIGVCALAYVLVLAGAQFDVLQLNDVDLDRLDADRTIPEWFTSVAQIFTVIPIPARMWAGTLTLMSGLGYEMPVYFLGEIRPHGHPLYFPIALLVKAPVTLIAFAAIGAALLIQGFFRRRFTAADLWWVLPGPLYVFLASRVPIQLGVRLILPALPFAVLTCACAIEWMRKQRHGRWVAATGIALFAFETARVYPHSMAFFNVAAGGPSSGFRYLADSNLDWGQGLGELQRWAKKHTDAPLSISYFGADMIFRYFREGTVLLLPPPWTDALAKGRTVVAPQPGIYYAISPTMLPGQFFLPKYRDFYSAFKQMTPIARPGYSIFVYRVDAVK